MLFTIPDEAAAGVPRQLVGAWSGRGARPPIVIRNAHATRSFFYDTIADVTAASGLKQGVEVLAGTTHFLDNWTGPLYAIATGGTSTVQLTKGGE